MKLKVTGLDVQGFEILSAEGPEVAAAAALSSDGSRLKRPRSANTRCVRVGGAHSGNRRRPVPEEAFRGLLLRGAPAVPSCGRGIPVCAKGPGKGFPSRSR